MSYTREQLIEALEFHREAMLRDHAAALKQARREALEEAKNVVLAQLRLEPRMGSEAESAPGFAQWNRALRRAAGSILDLRALDASEAKPTCPPHDWGKLDLNTTLGTACTKCGVLGLTVLMGAIKANRNDASEAGEGRNGA